MNKNYLIGGILILLVVIGTALFFGMQKNIIPASTQVSDTVDNWKTYTNSKSTFSIKLPPSWFVHTGVTGNEMVMYYPVDNPNFREEQTVTMIIAVSQNAEQKTLFEEAEKVINETKSLFNKDYKIVNQNYIILTSKNGRSLMALTHYQALTYVFSVNGDLEKNRPTIDKIISTFTFLDSSNNITNNISNYDTAIKILQAVPEIQIIENAVIKNGTKTFFTQGDENGDVVKIWLYEGGFPDRHTTRIDIFNVNIKTQVITVDDVAMISGQETITLDEWKKTIKGRFD